MTEAEWLATESFWPLWHAAAESAVGIVPERVKRRIGVYACRRVAHLLTDPASVAMLAACEGYVEGRLTPNELAVADAAAFAVVARDRQADSPTPAHLAAQAAAWLGPDDTKVGRAVEFSTEAFGLLRLLETGLDPADLGAFWDHPVFVAGRADEERRLTAPFRDIAGGRPATAGFDPGWQTVTVRAVAAAAYDADDWSRLPVLADALEDAGCDGDDLLAHLRGPGPHVRGCWAVDAVLGHGHWGG